MATVTAHLLSEIASEVPGADRALPVLEVSLIARAQNALSDWLDRSTPSPRVEAVEQGVTPFVEEAHDGSLRAGLPLRWVADVWARGLAVVGGRFSLAVVETSVTRVVLETFDDDLRSRRHLTVELEALGA